MYKDISIICSHGTELFFADVFFHNGHLTHIVPITRPTLFKTPTPSTTRAIKLMRRERESYFLFNIISIRHVSSVSSVSSARVLCFFGYFGIRKGYRIKPNKTSVRFGSEPVNSVCKSCCRTSSTSKSISTSRNQNSLQNFVKYLISIQVNRLDC